MKEALTRQPPEPAGTVQPFTITVRERLAALQALLARDGHVRFEHFIAASRGRIWRRAWRCWNDHRTGRRQKAEPFGPILIVATVPAALTGPDP
ncbi:MAG: hypothetical protein U0531_15185 [Dehalococcoidia bacterium]